MKEIFCQILSMSLSAGILILVIVAVRLWLSRVSRNLTVGLWGIAALRLIFPFSLQSRVSLIPEATAVPAQQVAQTAVLQRPVLRPRWSCWKSLQEKAGLSLTPSVIRLRSI